VAPLRDVTVGRKIVVIGIHRETKRSRRQQYWWSGILQPD
jgi:hypothetical protein